MLTAGGTLATSIGGVTVTFNGVAAPLVSAQANEVVAIAPFELSGLTMAPVVLQYNGLTSNTYTVAVVAQNPDVLAVTNSDWTANSATNPAKAGAGITIWLTGIGQTNPPSKDGAVNQPPPALPVNPPAVMINGYPANVTYFGAAGGEVAGVMQLNSMLPGTAPQGGQVWVAVGSTTGVLAYISQ